MHIWNCWDVYKVQMLHKLEHLLEFNFYQWVEFTPSVSNHTCIFIFMTLGFTEDDDLGKFSLFLFAKERSKCFLVHLVC